MQDSTLFSWKASTPKLDWKRGFAAQIAPVRPTKTLVLILPQMAILGFLIKQAQGGSGSKAA